MSAFTPEQEARIAQIMQDLLKGMARHRAEVERSESEDQIESEMAWACCLAGITPPKGKFDD